MAFSDHELKLYQSEIQNYHAARELGQSGAARLALGRAHIISQKSPLRHLQTHCLMFSHSLRPIDLKELWAQLVRILLTLPAHLMGRIPVGNTGWSDVPLTKPMPLPKDLEALFTQKSPGNKNGNR